MGVAPELLPYMHSLVSEINGSFDEFDTKIVFKPSLNPNHQLTRLKCKCQLVELGRIKYLLTSYLRCRIQKIQKFFLFYGLSSSSGQAEGLMSYHEREFVEKYTEIWENLMMLKVSGLIPKKFQHLMWQAKLHTDAPKDMFRRPQLKKHVVFRSLADLPNILDFEEGGLLKEIKKE